MPDICANNDYAGETMNGKCHIAVIVIATILSSSFCMACEPINGSFATNGRDVNNHQNVNLALLLGVLKQRRENEPKTVAVQIYTDTTLRKIIVTPIVDNGLPGEKQIYADVKCMEGEWHYLTQGSISADGIYRNFNIKYWFSMLEDKSLQVRVEEDVVSGLIFQDRSSKRVTAIFATANLRN
jgi:hypothetical protein